jgi:hypothetical protein
MCLLPEPCQAVCKHEQITLSVLDLVVDASALVRDFANLVLDLIMEADEEWRDNIREKRFEICNREWLDFLKGASSSARELRSLNLMSPAVCVCLCVVCLLCATYLCVCVCTCFSPNKLFSGGGAARAGDAPAGRI